MTRHARIQEVLAFLGIDQTDVLSVLRQEGLFSADELEPFEADELRVAAMLMRELGVNAAGVEVALHLRRRLLVLQQRLADVLEGMGEGERE